MNFNDLTYTEETIMRVLWSINSGYYKDIMEAHPEPKPHQNTVSTYLKILQEKGYISTENEGRIHKYSVKIQYSDYKAEVLKMFLDRYFENSADVLIANLIENSYVDADHLAVILNNVKETDSSTSAEIQDQEKISDYIIKITKPDKEKNKKKKKKKKKK